MAKRICRGRALERPAGQNGKKPFPTIILKPKRQKAPKRRSFRRVQIGKLSRRPRQTR